jgi:predicted ABC-type ATPase
MPNLYILAGPNGARKTTAAYTLLPEVLGVVEFVNADEIARGLSPFNVESVAFEAGRLMLQRIDQLLEKRLDFAFETTLSTRSYVQTIKRAHQAGYSVNLFFVYLSSPELAVQRVEMRVAAGGHNIPVETIFRRYDRALNNLFRMYLPICDYYTVIDNSGDYPQEIVTGGKGLQQELIDPTLWKILGSHYGHTH